jgi:adenylate kinase family enzyme
VTRVAILGNSGAGKSMLAGWLARAGDLAALDLDTVAWEPGQPAVERPDELAMAEVTAFCAAHPRWVIEGCYANLIAAAFAFEPLLVFLNPGPDACAEHCRARPWEPHKFASKQEQDAGLPFLLDWVAAYYTREGPLSLRAHRQVYDAYAGPKVELQRVPQLDPPDAALLAWLR